MPKDIYHIQEMQTTDGQLVFDVSVHADHPVFKGHFPESPVTPGVVQIQMVTDILARYFDKPLKLKLLRTCKFLQVLDPLSCPSLTVTIRYKGEESLEVSATGQRGESVFFKMQASYI